MKLRLILLLVLLLVPAISSAQAFAYECEIKQIMKLDASDLLKDPTMYDSILLGKNFTVDDATGKIEGLKFLSTSDYETVTVISNGRQENGLRVVAVGRAPTSVTTFLYVDVTSEAKEKPFVLMDTSFVELVVSGTCIR